MCLYSWDYTINNNENEKNETTSTDLQSFTKCLRQTLVFMWNIEIRDSFNFSFSAVFC